VTRTERSEQTASAPMGLFATLRAFAGADGSGASAVRLSLALVGLLVAVVLSPASALAAPPETPETTTATPTATTAVLHGVLNPAKPGTPGSYQFSYAQSATECTPGTLDPESPELAMGAEKEAKSVTVTGLEPNKQYAFCIAAYGLFGGVTEPAFGAAVPFKTLTAKPAVDGESTSAVSSTAATLEAQLNPNNQSTTYVFEYSTKEKAGALEGTIVKVPVTPPTPLEGFGDQTVSVPTGALLPGTTYFYRVVAKNATGTTDGTVSATGFTTPPTPKTEAVTAITATTATFHGKLKPLNEKVATEYAFDYNTGEEPACNGESRTTAAGAGTGKGTEATATTAVTGLQPNQKYTVCLVSITESGSQVDPTPVHFDTPAAAPTIEASSEKASNVTPYEATLEAQVNPDNQPTTYVFEYSTTEAGGKLTGTIVKLEGESPLEGGGQQTASVATGHVLTPGTTYHFRITAKNASGPVEGSGEFATQAATAPVIESEGSSGVTAELATLETTVDPVAQETTCSFEYGTEPALSSGVTTVACNNPNALGAGDSGVSGSVSLTGLIPSTTYYYRAIATNAAGTTTDPTIEHFETGPAGAPVIANETASGVEQTNATLEGEITPEHVATTYQFEYLTEAQYNENGKTFSAAQTSPGAKPLAAEEPATKVSAKLTGLTAGTAYVYRLVATSKCQAGEPCVTDGPTKTFTTPSPGAPAPGTCPNEARRAEQPDAQALPECRAYEMVSPVNTEGQDATDPFVEGVPRAAESGEAITYASRGDFGDPVGSGYEDQYLSKRGPEGWTTQAISPPRHSLKTETVPPYLSSAFTPELTEGIASTGESLTGEASEGESILGLYVANLAGGTYRYVTYGYRPVGASTDLSHVVVSGQSSREASANEVVSEWVDGRVVPISVTNRGEELPAVVGEFLPQHHTYDSWGAVSADGSRVIYTRFGSFGQVSSPRPPGDVYMRVNTEQPQSPIAAEEAQGTGTLTEGSNVVTGLVAASGTTEKHAERDSTAITVDASIGRFVVGQLITGPGIAPGTTITAISISPIAGTSGRVLTLSQQTEAELEPGSPVTSEGPAPFAVGQPISADGIPPGTTIAKVAQGTLILSAPAVSSGATVSLEAGGGCTVEDDACTIDVSASERERENPAGPRPARYWGASTDGSHVFFTSTAELTEDAYTGTDGQGANLYEYDLERPAGERLKDLTVDHADPNGAAVQNVVQVSEHGSYVYFVADGALAAGATAGEPNLYVLHNGETSFVAATPVGEEAEESYVVSSAASPEGSRLAFISNRPLTGYDTEPAEPGECSLYAGAPGCQEIYLYDAETNSLACASCDPTGARPTGEASFGPRKQYQWALYRARNLLNDGTLFFDSTDELVPSATGRQLNVYQYKNGHVSAISNVDGGGEAFFLDASANGNDVFLATPDRLLPQATTNNMVVYDARVNGGYPVAVPPSACSGESCRPPESSQPAAESPASSSFSGPPNPAPPPPSVVKPKLETKAQRLAKALKACHKDRKKKKRQACERVAHKKYAGKSSAKTSNTAKTSSRTTYYRRASR
jgi:phosphodiesterase/alkaline phosphatase D-like protein